MSVCVCVCLCVYVPALSPPPPFFSFFHGAVQPLFKRVNLDNVDADATAVKCLQALGVRHKPTTLDIWSTISPPANETTAAAATALPPLPAAAIAAALTSVSLDSDAVRALQVRRDGGERFALRLPAVGGEQRVVALEECVWGEGSHTRARDAQKSARRDVVQLFRSVFAKTVLQEYVTCTTTLPPPPFFFFFFMSGGDKKGGSGVIPLSVQFVLCAPNTPRSLLPSFSIFSFWFFVFRQSFPKSANARRPASARCLAVAAAR